MEPQVPHALRLQGILVGMAFSSLQEIDMHFAKRLELLLHSWGAPEHLCTSYCLISPMPVTTGGIVIIFEKQQHYLLGRDVPRRREFLLLAS
jgi:hypothetical protein